MKIRFIISLFFVSVLLLGASCTSQIDQNDLKDKLNRILSNQSSISNTNSGVVVDVLPPVINVISPESGQEVGSLITVIGTVVDSQSGVDKIYISINYSGYKELPIVSGIWQTNISLSEYREHNISIYAIDKTGNKSDTKVLMVTRGNVPSVIIQNPTTGYVFNSTSVSVYGTATIDYPGKITKVEISTNGSAYFDIENTNWAIYSLEFKPNSTNTVKARATANNGKTGTSALSIFYVDQLGPNIFFNSNITYCAVYTNRIRFTGASIDAGVGTKEVFFKLNGASFKKCASNSIWDTNLSLNLGTNRIKIYGVDYFGYVSATNEYIVQFKDTNRPAVQYTIAPYNTIESNTFTVQGTAFDFESGVKEVWLKHNSGIFKKISVGTSWNSNLTLINGTNTVYCYCIDNVGNRSKTNSTIINIKYWHYFGTPGFASGSIGVNTKTSICVSKSNDIYIGYAGVIYKCTSGIWNKIVDISGWDIYIALSVKNTLYYVFENGSVNVRKNYGASMETVGSPNFDNNTLYDEIAVSTKGV